MGLTADTVRSPGDANAGRKGARGETQRRLLEALTEFVADNGYSPTERELAAAAGISRRTAHDHIEALERRGLVEQQRNADGQAIARSLVPVEQLAPIPGGTAEVRLGRYQDVLADVEADTVIVDAPFSKKTHAGALSKDEHTGDGSSREPIHFAHWTEQDVAEFVSFWAPRTRRWIASLTDDVLAPAWRQAYADAGFQTFATVGVVISGMGVRARGDGPASWTLHLVVGRRRGKSLSTVPGARSIWRALPGGYKGPKTRSMKGGRGKPPWLLDQLVAHYSDPGMTVVDPCAGWGQALISARKLGRHAIGAEMDAAAFERARRALQEET